MNGRQFLEMLARLPARVWLQGIVGLLAFVVLAVLGFAVIAGVAAVVVLAILGIKAKTWLKDLFASQPGGPPARREQNVTDVQYEIIERRDDHIRR